tara:strand:+ start:1240 stop:1608 length:369 start_codon:yes stop_codon:yes gene_type:complete
MNKEVVNDKSVLFALNETTMHELRVSPNSEQIMKVWVKEPTWLQVEQALSSVMDLNQQTQSMNLDLNKMYRFMVENFIEKTEPSLNTLELLKLSPYIGSQLKEVLPNPFNDMITEADTGKEN